MKDYKEIITIEPSKRGGKATIRGMRFSVTDILNWLASSMTISEILIDFDELTKEDIYASLSYAEIEKIKSTRLLYENVVRSKNFAQTFKLLKMRSNINLLSFWIILSLISCSVKTNTKNDGDKLSNSISLYEKKENFNASKIEVVDTIDYEIMSVKFKQNKLTQLKKGQSYSQEFEDGDLIESFKYFGSIKSENEIYRVYYFFKKIMIANGYRGQSSIVFLGLKEMFAYSIDFDQAPTKLEFGRLYFGDKSVYIDTLREMLIIPNDGINRQKKIKSKIISELKMY